MVELCRDAPSWALLHSTGQQQLTIFFNIFNPRSVESAVRRHGYGGPTVHTFLSVCVQVSLGVYLEEELLSGS